MEVLDKRLTLVSEPTPLRNAVNLSKQFGRDVLLKEDDTTGICFGGNKVRKLEYLIYDAINCQADTIITTGGVQSNHARLTTAIARKYGLKPELVLKKVEKHKMDNGNVLLYDLMDAKIHLVHEDDEIKSTITHLEEKIKREGGQPYTIPLGGSNAIGVLGYVRAALELKQQLDNRNINEANVVLPVGSGGTMAGIILANLIWKLDLNIIGISVSRSKKTMREMVKDLMKNTSKVLNTRSDLSGDYEPVIYDEFVGPGYGIPDRDTIKAIRVLAKTEGVILDPVYTGKAMNGLLTFLEDDDSVLANAPVIFWHTGGSPAVFAYKDELITPI